MNTLIRYSRHGEIGETVACDVHLASMLESFDVSGAKVLSETYTEEECKHVRCRENRDGNASL